VQNSKDQGCNLNKLLPIEWDKKLLILNLFARYLGGNNSNSGFREKRQIFAENFDNIDSSTPIMSALCQTIIPTVH
jgi:hypothetical protein